VQTVESQSLKGNGEKLADCVKTYELLEGEGYTIAKEEVRHADTKTTTFFIP